MIVRPEIPYVPSMYKHTKSDVGDWPAVVFWYATDRKTQDKYVETWMEYLKRSTASALKTELDEIEKNVEATRAAYEKGCADLADIAAAEGRDPTPELDKHKRAFENLLMVRRKKSDQLRASMTAEPFATDDDRDAMRRELFSLVLRRIVIGGTEHVWPSTVAAQQDMLTASGIAPNAWEEAIGAFAQTAYWDGALPKS